MRALSTVLSPLELQLLGGIFLSLVVSLLAWRTHALSTSGMLAALLTGSLIFGLGGLPWAALLLGFFISSSALSKAFARRKAAINEKYAKGSQRDWGQVLANGGLGTLLALVYAAKPGQTWTWVAFAGAMAAVNADTWATELGVFSAIPPRLISNGNTVEAGTSGGVTPLGYLAALGGAAFIAAVAAAFTPGRNILIELTVIILGGVAGSSFDSLLGATAQAIYYCPTCQKETERHPIHSCGSQTQRLRGWRWLNNDWVNFACSLAGALVAVGLSALFF